MIVEGDSITIDLTGSNAEVPTGFNVPFEGSLLVGAYYAIRTILLDEAVFPEHVPQNDGVFRPVEVIAPKGTIYNPTFPRACFSRFTQVQRVVDNVDPRPERRAPRADDGRKLGRHPLLRVLGVRRGAGRVLALPRGQRGRVRRPPRQGRDGLRRQPDGEHAQQPDRGARPALPGPLRPVRAAARAGGARQVARRHRHHPAQPLPRSRRVLVRGRPAVRPAARRFRRLGRPRRLVPQERRPRRRGVPRGQGDRRPLRGRRLHRAGRAERGRVRRPARARPGARARGRPRRLHDARDRARGLRRRLRATSGRSRSTRQRPSGCGRSCARRGTAREA